jgi:hypothetical protein
MVAHVRRIPMDALEVEMLWFNRNGHLDKGDRIIRGGVR